jgi:hypothetical protein
VHGMRLVRHIRETLKQSMSKPNHYGSSSTLRNLKAGPEIVGGGASHNPHRFEGEVPLRGILQR